MINVLSEEENNTRGLLGHRETNEQELLFFEKVDSECSWLSIALHCKVVGAGGRVVRSASPFSQHDLVVAWCHPVELLLSVPRSLCSLTTNYS